MDAGIGKTSGQLFGSISDTLSSPGAQADRDGRCNAEHGQASFLQITLRRTAKRRSIRAGPCGKAGTPG